MLDHPDDTIPLVSVRYQMCRLHIYIGAYTVVLKNNVTSFLVTDRQVNTDLAIKYQGLGVL